MAEVIGLTDSGVTKSWETRGRLWAGLTALSSPITTLYPHLAPSRPYLQQLQEWSSPQLSLQTARECLRRVLKYFNINSNFTNKEELGTTVGGGEGRGDRVD